MKKLIWGTVLVGMAAWLLPAIGLLPDWDVWAWRKQLIYFSGLASFLLMTVVMLLAIRPHWLEKPLGGLDKMYSLHKWAGIWSVVFALLHYGIKLAKGPMLMLFGEATKGPRIETFLDVFRGSAKDLGEWSLWIFAAMVLVALWQRFPYHLWRYVHKALAVFYLIIVFHSIVLTPAQWWLQPTGMLIALASVLGTYAALVSLSGRIGRSRTHSGKLLEVRHLQSDMVELVCQLDGRWQHEPGQFAFVRFEGIADPHPFTIASADQGNGKLHFAIKALGDHTRQLVDELQPGQSVSVEGPYGRFDLPQQKGDEEQVWVAAGIGVTPFIAWLEGLQERPEQAPVASLHYCANNEQEAVFADRLQQLCDKLPSIRLHVHLSQRDGKLDSSQLLAGRGDNTKVWFCGPEGFAESIAQAMNQLGMNPHNLHRELFRMR